MGAERPPSYDTMTEFRRVAGEQAKCVDGTNTLRAYGEEAGKFNQFFWAKGSDYANKISVSKTDAEFEANWTQCMDPFYKTGDYATAMKDQLESSRRLQTR